MVLDLKREQGRQNLTLKPCSAAADLQGKSKFHYL